jgi:hypothetical protein
MSDSYDDKHFALILAAVAAGLSVSDSIDRATRIMQLLGYIK